MCSDNGMKTWLVDLTHGPALRKCESESTKVTSVNMDELHQHEVEWRNKLKKNLSVATVVLYHCATWEVADWIKKRAHQSGQASSNPLRARRESKGGGKENLLCLLLSLTSVFLVLRPSNLDRGVWLSLLVLGPSGLDQHYLDGFPGPLLLTDGRDGGTCQSPYFPWVHPSK